MRRGIVRRATHLGTFLGVAPTGRTVTLRGVHVDRLVDGRIAERWETVDLLSLLADLGVTPLPPVQASLGPAAHPPSGARREAS